MTVKVPIFLTNHLSQMRRIITLAGLNFSKRKWLDSLSTILNFSIAALLKKIALKKNWSIQIDRRESDGIGNRLLIRFLIKLKSLLLLCKLWQGEYLFIG